jgi:hypothetical protein
LLNIDNLQGVHRRNNYWSAPDIDGAYQTSMLCCPYLEYGIAEFMIEAAMSMKIDVVRLTRVDAIEEEKIGGN